MYRKLMAVFWYRSTSIDREYIAYIAYISSMYSLYIHLRRAYSNRNETTFSSKYVFILPKVSGKHGKNHTD